MVTVMAMSQSVTGRFVFNCGFETFALGVFQILAQQHAGPVTGLGAAGASLDVDKAVQRVSLVSEHAAELKVCDQRSQFGGFSFDGHQAIVIAFFLAHLKEFKVVGQLAGQVGDGHHHAVQGFFLFAQFLSFFGVIPDRGIFERCVDGSQPFRFGIVVKDTPVTRGYERSGL